MIAGLAVSAAVFAIDKPYSYRIPAGMELQPGMRVLVPFGRGNRHSEAIVLTVGSGEEHSLKPILQRLDDEPILAPWQLRLAEFMRERCFCTYYDAVRAMLPAGFWFKSRQTFALNPDAMHAPPDLSARPLAQKVFALLLDLGGSAPEQTLRAQFEQEEEFQSAVRWLLSKKLMFSSLELSQKSTEKTTTIASLAVTTEEAEQAAIRRQRSAPLQAEVLRLLCTVGEGSCREICYLTGASTATIRRLHELGLLELREQPELRRPKARPVEPEAEPTLSAEQQEVFDGLLGQMRQAEPGAALLYGVTGSGKTAVYIRLIYEALRAGKTAMLLVPEIALTPQLLDKLRAHFGASVAVLHSSLRVGERYDEWRRIRMGEAKVVVGTRSAVFAPVEHPGILILDEEQEHTYKSENNPRYHARQIALYRGYKEHALVLLGSATPSVETMYLARTGKYSLYTLRTRFNQKTLPAACLIDMKQELRSGNDLDISRELEEALRDNILAKKQSILFLNRRGNSRYVVCMDCGEVPSCPRCSVHLTYHSANHRLMCHYCGYSEPVKNCCTRCGGEMRPVGSGTQKIEQELAQLFPDTEVLRMDADTVSAANGHESILTRFREQKVPILLGTQMVAKGLDFEDVTLVGVLDADMSLYTDSFRAAETTFSLITQVAGRSGRGAEEGRAIIQTMTPENPVIRLAAEQNYDAFYDLEIHMRELRGCPPFADFFTVTFMGLQERDVLQASMRVRDALAANLSREPYSAVRTRLLGPAPAAVARVNYSYRYRLTLVCRNTAQIRRLLAYVLSEFANDRQNRGVSAFADINSYD